MAKKKSAPVTSPTPDAKVIPKDDRLDTVVKDFNAAWEYCKGSWHERWFNNYKLYNNQRVKIGYYGTSDTFVPMAFSTVETMTSALFGMKPSFNYLPPKQKSDQKTDILNSLVDYFWDKDQWSIKVINTGRGMLMRGTAVDYFFWDGDHPCMINVPLRDFFIDPTATTLENARYMGRRYLISKAELEEFEIVDLEAKPDKDGNLPFKKKYTNLDQLETPEPTTTADTTVSSEDNTDKQEKDLFYGSTLSGEAGKQIEVIEYWTNDRIISIANRRVVIEDSENYFKAKARANGDKYPEGLMPFTAARDYVDESLFYAKGEVDFIFDQQEDLNDNTNQRKDAVSYALNQMYTLDPKYADQIETVENMQGAVYPFEANMLVPVSRGQVPSEAFAEGQNIKNEIRETTAANEIVKGAPQDGGKATATEINAQIAGSGQRVNLKVTQIENEYFHRMARILFAMIRLYVNDKKAVQIIGKDGAHWEEFDPEEYKDGEYEPRVQLQISIENQKSQDASNAKEMYAAFLHDPDVNQLELKKLTLAKGFRLDPDEVEALLTLPEMPAGMPMGAPAGMPDMMPPAGAIPPAPMGPPMPKVNISLKGDLTPAQEEALSLAQGIGVGAPPMPATPPLAQPGMPPTGPTDPSQMYTDPTTGQQIPLAVLRALTGQGA